MFKKLAISAAALTLIAAACGGASDDAADSDSANTSSTAVAAAPGSSASPTTSQAAAPTTTSPPPVQVGGNEYCAQADESNPFDGINFFGADLEEQVDALLDLLDQMEGAAPSEIAADVRVLADAGRSFAEMLAEFDYDLLAIPPDDPRLLGFDNPELQQAIENISAFCGIDPDEVDDAVDGQTGIGGLGDDELPDDFPAELVPPGLLGVLDNGLAGLIIQSSEPSVDIADFYEGIFGPGNESDGNIVFTGPFDGGQWVVSVSDEADGGTVIILIGF